MIILRKSTRIILRANISVQAHAAKQFDAFLGTSKMNTIDFTNALHACQQTKDSNYASRFLREFIISEEKSKKNMTLALQCVESCDLPRQLVLQLLMSAPATLLDEQHYTVALGILRHSKDLAQQTFDLCAELLGARLVPLSQILSTTILSFYAEMHDDMYLKQADAIITNAFAVLKLMQEHVPLAQHHYGALLVVCGRCQRADLIDNTYQSMLAAGFSDNAYSLTALMTAYTYNKDYVRAFATYERIAATGLRIKTVSLTKILQLCLLTQQQALGLRIATDWLSTENQASWEVYRLLLFLVKEPVQDASYSKALLALKNKVQSSLHRSPRSEKIPANMLSFCFTTLYKRGLFVDVFESLPYSQLAPEELSATLSSLLVAILEKNDLRAMLAMQERLRYHPEIPPALRQDIIGYCVVMLLNVEETAKAKSFLATNIDTFRTDRGDIRAGRIFGALGKVKATRHTQSVLGLIKTVPYFDAGVLAAAFTKYLPFDELLALLEYCATDALLTGLIRDHCHKFLYRLRDSAAELVPSELQTVCNFIGEHFGIEVEQSYILLALQMNSAFVAGEYLAAAAWARQLSAIVLRMPHVARDVHLPVLVSCMCLLKDTAALQAVLAAVTAAPSQEMKLLLEEGAALLEHLCGNESSFTSDVEIMNSATHAIETLTTASHRNSTNNSL